MLVTGVIASVGEQREAVGPEALRGARQEGQHRLAPLGVAQSSVGIWKIVGASSASAGAGAIVGQRRGGLGRQVDRAGRSLAPLERRGEGVDDRLDPRLDSRPARRRAARRGSSPAGRRGAAGAEVDLAPPARRRRLGEVGLDPLQARRRGGRGRGRRDPSADEVDELGDRRLGLAVARAAGDVGEEGVGGADADDLLAVSRR